MTNKYFDSAQAIQEGWDLFEVNGLLHLQRIDWPDDESEPKFVCDTDAIIFVANEARRGSLYHRKALDLIGRLAVRRPGRRDMS
mgnify:FL=1